MAVDAGQHHHLLAIGIISAPHYLERRLGMRHSWLQWSNVRPGASILARFVVRSGGAPRWLDELLATEQARYGDVLRMPSVAWNESRLRGPMLSLAAWMQYAADHQASFVAKMDDDAYLHAPDFERLLRTVESQLEEPSGTVAAGTAVENSAGSRHVYIGSMTWFHWQPLIFERSGHGWNYGQALKNGATCRNATSAALRCGGARCGACVGPFQFASGYLLVVSAPTAAWLARDGGLMRRDADRLRASADGSLVSRSGKPRDKMMEDVWLGSLLFRDPPPQPLRFVTLVGWQGLISDAVRVPPTSHLPPRDICLQPRCNPRPRRLALALDLALGLGLALALGLPATLPPHASAAKSEPAASSPVLSPSLCLLTARRQWGLETTRQALLTHVKAKSLPRLLALHAYTTRRHCAPRLALRCKAGCASFAGKYRGGAEEVVRDGRPAFCRGTQRDVRRCVFEEPPASAAPRRDDGCCAGKACVAKINLLKDGLPSEAEAQQRRVLDDNGALLKLLPAPGEPPPRRARPRKRPG